MSMHEVLYHGYLAKESKDKLLFKKKWKKRYFVLSITKPLIDENNNNMMSSYNKKNKTNLQHHNSNAIELSYYEDESMSKKLGGFDLKSCEELKSHIKNSQFNFVFSLKLQEEKGEKTCFLASCSEEEMATWVEVLNKCLQLINSGNLSERKSLTSSTPNLLNYYSPNKHNFKFNFMQRQMSTNALNTAKSSTLNKNKNYNDILLRFNEDRNSKNSNNFEPVCPPHLDFREFLPLLVNNNSTNSLSNTPKDVTSLYSLIDSQAIPVYSSPPKYNPHQQQISNRESSASKLFYRNVSSIINSIQSSEYLSNPNLNFNSSYNERSFIYDTPSNKTNFLPQYQPNFYEHHGVRNQQNKNLALYEQPSKMLPHPQPFQEPLDEISYQQPAISKHLHKPFFNQQQSPNHKNAETKPEFSSYYDYYIEQKQNQQHQISQRYLSTHYDFPTNLRLSVNQTYDTPSSKNKIFLKNSIDDENKNINNEDNKISKDDVSIVRKNHHNTKLNPNPSKLENDDNSCFSISENENKDI